LGTETAKQAKSYPLTCSCMASSYYQKKMFSKWQLYLGVFAVPFSLVLILKVIWIAR